MFCLPEWGSLLHLLSPCVRVQVTDQLPLAGKCLQRTCWWQSWLGYITSQACGTLLRPIRAVLVIHTLCCESSGYRQRRTDAGADVNLLESTMTF